MEQNWHSPSQENRCFCTHHSTHLFTRHSHSCDGARCHDDDDSRRCLSRDTHDTHTAEHRHSSNKTKLYFFSHPSWVDFCLLHRLNFVVIHSFYIALGNLDISDSRKRMQTVFTGFQKGLSKVIRVSGQALDKVGQTLETNPHVDRRK